MTISSLFGRDGDMIGRRQVPGSDFEDDGAGRLAILGVLLVMVVVAAGVVLNMQL